MKNTIINNYTKDLKVYSSCRERIVLLIKDLLSESKIQIHTIESRTKDVNSLSKKIDRKNKYKDLKEITDLVGIRVITYLESDVDKIDSLIRNEFEVDNKNSIDKRKLETNQFGYRSLHIVANISKERCRLSEYKKYKSIKFEIQIRSILQHAWAEIEHDLGYKGKSSLPETQIRSFNRLAALLETADIEFDRLKENLTSYENLVPELIHNEPEKVSINQASLKSFTLSNPIFELAREYVRKECDSNFMNQRESYNEYIEKFTKIFDIHNIKELKNLLEETSDEYIRFVKEFIKPGISPNLKFSLPLFWFQHFLAAKTEDINFLCKYFNVKTKPLPEIVAHFIETYQKTKKQ
jgi:putative GTP pyrophosphokinase